MSKIKLTGDSSGYVEISAPSAAGNNTLELPVSGSKIVVSDGSDNINISGIATVVNGLNVTGGSVGIGTNSPFAKTHIEINAVAGAGSGSAAALWLRNSNQTANNSATIFAGNNSSQASAAINFIHNNYITNSGSITFDTRTNSSTYAERLRIDSSGRVTMPYQPYARSSSSSLVSATNAIPLNANNLNRGGITISGNRFTVPVAGAYVIGYHHLGNSGSGACQIEIRVNNNPIAGSRTQDTNSSNDSFGTQTIADLSANDYVEFWVVAGTTHGNSGYNHMWIWLIG